LPREAGRLIHVLIEARLLTTRVVNGNGVIEATHEALFVAWPTLRVWLDEEQQFLADLERIKSAYEVWAEAAPGEKPQALLHGLLLSNAHRWLVEHPQRFAGRSMETLRDFITTSQNTREADERARARDRDETARRLAAQLAAAQLNESRFLTSLAETELRHGNREFAGLIALVALPNDMRKPHPNRPLWAPAVGVVAEARPTGHSGVVLEGHEHRVLSAAWSADGTRIVTASADRTARIWDTKTGVQLFVLDGQMGWMVSAAWSPDGSRIVTSSVSQNWPDTRGRVSAAESLVKDTSARIWDVNTGIPLVALEGHAEAVLSVAYSPEGSRIVTASKDRTSRVWDAETGTPLAELAGHTDGLQSAAWSPDGLRIVTASRDGTARIWDAETGTPLAELMGHTDPVYSASYSPDALHIVTASSDKTARIWDSKIGAPLAVLHGHADTVYSACYSPDGLRVVTASKDKTARIWDVKTCATVAVLDVQGGEVFCAAYSPDGTRIVTAPRERTARVWDAWCLLTADTISFASVSSLRSLTAEERARVFVEVADGVEVKMAPVLDEMSIEQLRTAASTGNPYAHRKLAEMYERGDRAPANLERALFHHAVEARLFEEAGDEKEVQIAAAQRGSIARGLSQEAAVRIAYEAMDWRPLVTH
jgi:WD40 repeat protein